jgi:hypothetical protein
LAREQGVKPVRSPKDMAIPGFWKSDEELDAFLAEVRRARQADLA